MGASSGGIARWPGSSSIGAVVPGEEFELAFGADERLRVERPTAPSSRWLRVHGHGAGWHAGAATGRRGLALAAGAGLAVMSRMLNAFGPTVDFDWMAAISPIGWFMDDNPITRGFHPLHALQLAAGSALAVGAGWWRFLRRDLMT